MINLITIFYSDIYSCLVFNIVVAHVDKTCLIAIAIAIYEKIIYLTEFQEIRIRTNRFRFPNDELTPGNAF